MIRILALFLFLIFSVMPSHAIISIVFDDGRTTDYTLMKDVFTSRGIVGSSAIITSRVGTATYMTWAQIQELKALGWEITSHSHSHNYGQFGTDASAMQADIDSLESEFTANSVDIPSVFVYPGGVYTDTALCVLANNSQYVMGRITGQLKNDHKKIGFNKYLVSAFDGDSMAYGYMLNIVDVVESTQDWAIFYFHETDASDVTTIGNLIDYIQGKNIPIMSLKDGYIAFSAQ